MSPYKERGRMGDKRKALWPWADVWGRTSEQRTLQGSWTEALHLLPGSATTGTISKQHRRCNSVLGMGWQRCGVRGVGGVRQVGEGMAAEEADRYLFTGKGTQFGGGICIPPPQLLFIFTWAGE